MLREEIYHTTQYEYVTTQRKLSHSH